MPQPRAKRRITLSDLSDEDRRSLLAEAAEASKHNPRDVDGYADLTPREQAVRELMDARDHARECPTASGAELGRIEGYDARRPPDPASGAPERYFGVIRCVNCGGATVLDDRLEPSIEEQLERLDAEQQTEDPDDEL